MAVEVISLPVLVGSISGADSVCDGSTNTYSVALVSEATSYTWTLPTDWLGASTTEAIDATISVSGTISVTANNSCGSSSAVTKSVTVNPIPQVSFNITTGPVCSNLNPTISLNSGTPTGGTYSGSGVTGNTFDASALSAGSYVLTYLFTTDQGCTASDTAAIEVSVCTSVEKEVVQQVLLYPNPFTNAITITVNNAVGKCTVVLMDAIGNKISSKDVEEGKLSTSFNTQFLESGVYFVGVFADGKSIAVQKLFRVE